MENQQKHNPGYTFPRLPSIKIGDLIGYFYFPDWKLVRPTDTQRIVKAHGIVVRVSDNLKKGDIEQIEVVDIKTHNRLTILNGFVTMENEVK